MDNWEPLKIPFADIKDGTNNFQKSISHEELRWLYEGELFIKGKYRKVAVKEFNDKSGEELREFWNEIQLLGRQQHENLVTLLGFCHEDIDWIIVYEYAERGSLDQYIMSSNRSYTLSWLERLKIVVGAARGLDHLHNHAGVNQTIIHLDIRAKNIWLDDKWVPKISNLGSSILCVPASSETMGVVATPNNVPGYMDPEYDKTGIVTKKTDVFSFGLVLFELLCGRLCGVSEEDFTFFEPEEIQEYYDNGKLEMIIDPILPEQASSDSLRRYAAIAYKCLLDREHRPFIDVVKKELEEILKIEHEEIGRLKSISISSVEDDKYLKKKLPIQSFSLAEINNATNESAHGKPLGEGAFGKVYRGNISGKEVAVKCMNMNKNVEQGIQMFQKEIDLLSSCDHVNIISLVGYCDEEDEKSLVYEYMPNGSLNDYLFSRPNDAPWLTVEQCLEICIGVAKGLIYLHSGTHFNIIHSDLKTDNILLDRDLVPKISDFGLSRTRDVGPSTSQVVTNNIKGTDGYIAPECFKPNYKLSRKADVYAFGVVFLEVLCHSPPSKSVVSSALQLITTGELHKLIPQHVYTTITPACVRECGNLIWGCLHYDPNKRPVMNEVVERLEFALKLQKK